MKKLIFLLLFVVSHQIVAQVSAANQLSKNVLFLGIENDDLYYETSKEEGIYRLSNAEKVAITNSARNYDNNGNPNADRDKVKIKFEGKKYPVNEFAQGVPFVGLRNLFLRIGAIE